MASEPGDTVVFELVMTKQKTLEAAESECRAAAYVTRTVSREIRTFTVHPVFACLDCSISQPHFLMKQP